MSTSVVVDELALRLYDNRGFGPPMRVRRPGIYLKSGGRGYPYTVSR